MRFRARSHLNTERIRGKYVKNTERIRREYAENMTCINLFPLSGKRVAPPKPLPEVHNGKKVRKGARKP